MALSFAQRFPSSKEVAAELQGVLLAHALEPKVQALPQAGRMLAAYKVRYAWLLMHLFSFQGIVVETSLLEG